MELSGDQREMGLIRERGEASKGDCGVEAGGRGGSTLRPC